MFDKKLNCVQLLYEKTDWSHKTPIPRFFIFWYWHRWGQEQVLAKSRAKLIRSIIGFHLFIIVSNNLTAIVQKKKLIINRNKNNPWVLWVFNLTETRPEIMEEEMTLIKMLCLLLFWRVLMSFVSVDAVSTWFFCDRLVWKQFPTLIINLWNNVSLLSSSWINWLYMSYFSISAIQHMLSAVLFQQSASTRIFTRKCNLSSFYIKSMVFSSVIDGIKSKSWLFST